MPLFPSPRTPHFPTRPHAPIGPFQILFQAAPGSPPISLPRQPRGTRQAGDARRPRGSCCGASGVQFRVRVATPGPGDGEQPRGTGAVPFAPGTGAPGLPRHAGQGGAGARREPARAPTHTPRPPGSGRCHCAPGGGRSGSPRLGSSRRRSEAASGSSLAPRSLWEEVYTEKLALSPSGGLPDPCTDRLTPGLPPRPAAWKRPATWAGSRSSGGGTDQYGAGGGGPSRKAGSPGTEGRAGWAGGRGHLSRRAEGVASKRKAGSPRPEGGRAT